MWCQACVIPYGIASRGGRGQEATKSANTCQCRHWPQPGTMGTPQSWQRHWGTMVRGRHSPQVTAGPSEVTAGGMSWKALLNRNRGNWGKHSGKGDRLLRAPRWEKQACVAGLREALGLSLWGTHTCGFGGHRRARARGWGVTAAQVRGDRHPGEG